MFLFNKKNEYIEILREMKNDLHDLKESMVQNQAETLKIIEDMKNQLNSHEKRISDLENKKGVED